MNRLTLILVLTMTVLLGSLLVGCDAGFDAHKKGDYATALKEWTSLAEQGDASAQFNLGVMYDEGQGVPEDDKTAVKWYTLAAEQGNVYAQVNLGWMYGNGQGVPQDYVRAHMWINLSASQGIEGVDKERDVVANLMTPAQIAEAEKLAQECAAKNYKGC